MVISGEHCEYGSAGATISAGTDSDEDTQSAILQLLQVVLD